MNERIKSMWEVATGSVWPMKGKFTAGEYDHNLEKFAELIVRECAEKLIYRAEQYSKVKGQSLRVLYYRTASNIVLTHFDYEFKELLKLTKGTK
jgi:hypothetical protein